MLTAFYYIRKKNYFDNLLALFCGIGYVLIEFELLLFSLTALL